MAAAVETHGLTKNYGAHRVLDEIDLTVVGGSVFALLGPNGAGKTTLVRILATLVAPDGGTARVAGFDITRERHAVRRAISLTGQFVAVDELQTGRENLRLVATLHGLTGRRGTGRAADLLERFDLGEAADRRVATYSGGMRRRLDLAMSLVGSPDVLFLDEPTTGLDLPGRQAMWTVVTGLAAAGVTVFLTTQYLEEADQLADRIAVLDHGRIVADGSAAALKARVAQQRLELTAVDAVAYAAVLDRLGERAVGADPVRRVVGVATDGSAAQVRSLLAAVDPQANLLSHFTVRAATLDDAFLVLTGRADRKESVGV